VDDCGLSSSITQTLIAHYPKAYYPQGQTVNCGDNFDPQILGFPSSDDSSYNSTYNDSVHTMTDCAAFNIYKIVTRTWFLNDFCGQRTGTQEIILKDVTPPVLNVQGDLLLECDQIPDVFPLPESPLLIPATASDSCIGVINVTKVEVRPLVAEVLTNRIPECTLNILNARTTDRKWTATDTCGNSVTISQKISFRDTKPPYFIKPPKTNLTEITLPKASICKLSHANDKVGILNVPENFTYGDNCDTELKTPKYYGGLITEPDCDKVVYSWKLTDKCNNSISHDITIAIIAEKPKEGGANALTCCSLTLLLIWLFNLLLTI
jgi:hypothetical protein